MDIAALLQNTAAIGAAAGFVVVLGVIYAVSVFLNHLHFWLDEAGYILRIELALIVLSHGRHSS